jgi:hypothetical protein
MLRAALRTARAAQLTPRAAPMTPARAMGGGGAHPPSPNHVWTPAGGWFADPPRDRGVPSCGGAFTSLI